MGKELSLPGCEKVVKAREKASKEEAEIRGFLAKFLKEIDFPKTRKNIDRFGGCLDFESFIKELENFSKEKQLEFPDALKKRVRFWDGEAGFESIKKSPHMKVKRAGDPRDDFISWVHLIPLSLKGYERAKQGNINVWERETLRGKKFIYIPDPGYNLKPAVGDLAKRALKVVCLFASKRKTLDPGPIRFGDLLEELGQKNASQQTRKRIKDYLEAFGMTGVLIKEFDRDGKEILFEYSPYFSYFLWLGGVEKEAEIFPKLNKDLFNMLIENKLINYSYLKNVGQKQLPGMKDRDSLAQDMFVKLKGLKIRKYKMRNFLYRFGDFTEKELEKMTLKKIRTWVNKNIVFAKNLKSIEQVRLHNYRKKSRYLDQVVSIYPARWERALSKVPKEIETQIEEIIDWLHDPENKFYVKTPKGRNRDALKTMYKVAGSKFWDEVLLEFDEVIAAHNEDGLGWYSSYGDPGQSGAMIFWKNILEIYEKYKK